MAPSTKGRERATNAASTSLAERVKNHIMVILGSTLVSGFMAGMYVADQFRVSPRDFQIASLREEIGKLKTTDASSGGTLLTLPSCDGVSIRGIWPRRVAANDSFVIEGKAPEMPGFRLWLFASLRDGGAPYNPRGAVKLLPGNDWEIEEPGENRGESRSKHYRIFVVGEDGEKLIDEYRRTMILFTEEVAREWPEDDRRWPTIKSSLDWPGMLEKTRDMIPCGPPLQIVR